MPLSLTLGPVTFSTDKVPEWKPALQLGAEVDLGGGLKAGAKAGLDDVRDGIKVGADANAGDTYKASAKAQVHRDGIGASAGANINKKFTSKGKNLAAFINNVKSEPTFPIGDPQSQMILNAVDTLVEYVPPFLAWVVEQSGIDVENVTWVEGTVNVAVGVGVGGIYQPGWADTQGYHMVGGGATFVVAGVDGAAGVNTAATKMKVILSYTVSLVTVTVQAIMDL